MRIQSNINTAQYQNSINNIHANEERQKKASKELSTGKKVNTAADDAVALSISQKLMEEAKSLNTGSSNISYGIDAANIADSALANVSDSLGDIEQNTVRAMNGLYSDSDRAILQEANEQSVATINQTISQAQYNGKNLLDGSSGDINIYTGTSSMSIKEADAKSAVSELENFDVSVNSDAISTESLDNVSSSINSIRSQIGAQTNGLQSAYDVNNNTAENVTAAQAAKEDADFYESVTKMKSSGIVGAAQNMALKNQMDNESNLVQKMFEA